mgnify:CR=1 FL=1
MTVGLFAILASLGATANWRRLAEELVEDGQLDPDHIHTPGIFIDRIVEGVHEKRIEIRWRDQDAYQHVNQAVYLTYLEETLDDWIAANGPSPSTMTRCRYSLLVPDTSMKIRVPPTRRRP